MCYLFLFRNVWEHCAAQILLLHEDTCLLFGSQKYGSRVTKPYLLAHHVADPVLQLSQQRQFLTCCIPCTGVNGQLQTPSRVQDEELPCRAFFTDPDLPQEDGTPSAYWCCTEALQHLCACIHTAHVLHSSPPIIPHWSALVSRKDSLQVCKFYSFSFF